MTKKRKVLQRLSLFFCLICLLQGCSARGSGGQTGASVTVTLVSSDEYHLADGYEHQVTVQRGGEVRFLVCPNESYVVSGTDYPDGIVTDGPNNTSVLILPSVRYPTRVNVMCEKDSNIRSITYEANGGTVRSPQAEDTAPHYVVHHTLNGHLFPNTAIGTDVLDRGGYTLIGWNTAQDGGGVRTGLGSRYTGTQDVLYAEWAPWTEDSYFSFARSGEGYIVARYGGCEDTVAVPAIHNGLPVTGVAAGAFTDCGIRRLILPVTLRQIAAGAFTRCRIGELFFFDALLEFPDAAFQESPLPRVFLNAIQPPRYAGSGRASTYADKVDLLIQDTDRKKIVLFGGSGTYYSILAAKMEEMLGGEYAVINMGMNGWFPAMPQLSIIHAYLREGDVLLHIPEAASSTQLFNSTVFSQTAGSPADYDDRYMRSLELNYDLISLFDLNETSGFFDSYTRFNKARQDQPATDYSDYSNYINANGDYAGKKLPYLLDEPITDEADICPWLLTSEACARMDAVYESFVQNGIRVCLAYAAVNESALEATGDYQERATLFDQILHREIHNATVIEAINDSFYPGRVFYNSDWHLSEEADLQNTAIITEGLKRFL